MESGRFAAEAAVQALARPDGPARERALVSRWLFVRFVLGHPAPSYGMKMAMPSTALLPVGMAKEAPPP